MPEDIERFHIRVDDSTLDDLRLRLSMTRFPDQIEGAGWEYGTPIAYVRELVTYWRDEYDWRAQEARLNELDHFRIRIDGQAIHFVHARSPHADALPLLIVHGWPGSVVEFLDVIPRLTDPEAHGGHAQDAFHVIAPSLPGYGFSEPPRVPGWDIRRVAHAFVELMRRLGYPRYGAQGGDWGAQIATRLAALDPERCVALHLNMPIAAPPAEPLPITEEEQAGLAAMAAFQRDEGGVRAAAGDEARHAGHGVERLARRVAVVDRREVPRLERLRRRSRELFHPRPADHERDALLGDGDVRVVGPALLGDHAQRGAEGATGVRDGSDGGGALPQGRGAALPTLVGRAALQRHALGGHAARGHFAAMEQPELFVEDLRDFFRTVR